MVILQLLAAVVYLLGSRYLATWVGHRISHPSRRILAWSLGLTVLAGFVLGVLRMVPSLVGLALFALLPAWMALLATYPDELRYRIRPAKPIQ